MSGKSKEEIAFELVSKLKGVGVWGENNMKQILDMYAECLEATSGLRDVDGKTPSALRLLGKGNGASESSAQTAPMRPAMPLQQAPQVQSPQVRQQQQMVQQAYQQQQPPVGR